MESRVRLESFLPLAGFPTWHFYKFQPLIEAMLNSVQFGNNSTKNDRTKKLNSYCISLYNSKKTCEVLRKSDEMYGRS